MPVFHFDDPYLWRTGEEMVEYCDNFAAIGSGMDIAEASLCQRKQDENTSLATTIYHVFEAGKLATLAGVAGVGKDHTTSVLYPPDDKNLLLIRDVSSKGVKMLEQKFKEYGPKHVKSFDFDRKFLEVVEEVPKPSASQTSGQGQ